ncbi:uncharacterized protein LOC110229988 isoform X1 [Arabidopsis lyrata subsp. lyrata]|uniref:uncharacterized protein LOC110229988 isoform X1 n=1 Tax=Arabidopsis lyrata subsp. lyrata TaxID=81972 RepID=UPI000A29B893|nr:uncharacterized protein LOC110229988 isoform X1 [Arabidopsis lyrata subsp. lyrata]XP_020887043.1 uncharacterized protein LOC110229988 isoform X1 [Arabidopsis lyrata subsp. lyrata]|eukprot:XP_020887042.1 uncharacterized protein LOC110229988 isoform X1 [Arabidopsis lyrata subsp. lyrata]
MTNSSFLVELISTWIRRSQRLIDFNESLFVCVADSWYVSPLLFLTLDVVCSSEGSTMRTSEKKTKNIHAMENLERSASIEEGMIPKDAKESECGFSNSWDHIVLLLQCHLQLFSYLQKLLMSFSYELFVKLIVIQLQPFGLVNLGNSCYADAFLQCLALTRLLISYLIRGLHSKTCEEATVSVPQSKDKNIRFHSRNRARISIRFAWN